MYISFVKNDVVKRLTEVRKLLNVNDTIWHILETHKVSVLVDRHGTLFLLFIASVAAPGQ